MPWTITRLCIDCVDTGCVSVCPVDCIYEYVGEDKQRFPNMLYINPDECIDCGACDIALNHATLDLADQFKVKSFTQTEHPTSDQVAENKRKWGLDPNA